MFSKSPFFSLGYLINEAVVKIGGRKKMFTLVVSDSEWQNIQQK